MSVSMVTNSYPSINGSVVSVTPPGTNVTGWERNSLLAVAEVMVLAVILVMALLGNSLVLVVLLRRRKHLNPLHQFMLNLCLADLVVAMFQVTHVCLSCPYLFSNLTGCIVIYNDKNPIERKTKFQMLLGLHPYGRVKLIIPDSSSPPPS